MLNSPDWKIVQIVMNCQYSLPDDPMAVKVAFVNRNTAKKVQIAFKGEQYLEVAAQARRQLALREYVTVIDEPKPKKSVAAPAPIKGKKK